MIIKPNYRSLIFSDLDGCFLDHNDYQFNHAIDQAQKLEVLGIPLIFNSSKTSSEIKSLCAEIENRHPFIVENGSAVFIPKNYFSCRGHQKTSTLHYEVFPFSRERQHWLECIDILKPKFGGDFVNFNDLSLDEVIDLTGLKKDDAIAAMDRQYSEPVFWRSSQMRRTKFITSLQEKGATVKQGGRFLSVGGDCDKGTALIWLRQLFATELSINPVNDLAIGDSENDLPMLEAAQEALLIRSPNHTFPNLNRASGVFKSKKFGPKGWTEGIASWLQRHKINQGEC